MTGTPVSSRQLSRSDIIAILVIGEIFAWFLIIIRKTTKFAVPELLMFSLPVLMPLVALFLLWVFATLGRKRPFMFQLGKYAAVGFLNTGIDFSIINLLVLWTRITEGLGLGLLNTVSFTVAVVNSYLWNKYWTFSAKKTGARKTEFLQFVIVSFIGLLLNSGFVGGITKYVNPLFDLTPQQWVNVVKGTAVFLNLAWNFAGYKFIVFREKPTTG